MGRRTRMFLLKPNSNQVARALKNKQLIWRPPDKIPRISGTGHVGEHER
jgi:hypothetical protein